MAQTEQVELQYITAEMWMVKIMELFSSACGGGEG